MHSTHAPQRREHSSFAGPPPGRDEGDFAAFHPGCIKRAASFTAYLKQAEAYEHDPRLTKLALVRDLALGCPELSDAAFRQVVALIILVPPTAWDTGGLMVHIGNRLLGCLLGCSDCAVRRANRELEEAGLVLRHMDEANHPAAGRRFDLRPLAARHAELSARIAETFAAHKRARAERRFCRTAQEEPAATAADGTSPQGGAHPHGGAVKSDTPIDTDTAGDRQSEPVPGKQAEAVDKSADAPKQNRHQGSASRTKASKPKGYWRPTDPTPAPCTLTSAVALLSGISIDFATALKKSACDPDAPTIEELLDAADRLREFLSVPRSVWVESHGRLDRLERVAIMVAAMAKPQTDFRTSRTAWARSMLSRRRGEIDIWATIRKLEVSCARLN